MYTVCINYFGLDLWKYCFVQSIHPFVYVCVYTGLHWTFIFISFILLSVCLCIGFITVFLMNAKTELRPNHYRKLLSVFHAL